MNKVVSGIDLHVVTDEMHEHVYNLVDSSHGADVVNVLLDMHILEDEQVSAKGYSGLHHSLKMTR